MIESIKILYWKLLKSKGHHGYYTADPKGRRRPINDLSVSDIDMRDYPDFCDAHIDYAVWEDTGLELTESELDYLNENDYDIVYEATINAIY